VVLTSWVSITPWNPPRHLHATAIQKWWLICVGVVLYTAQDGRTPPVVASSARNQCSSRDDALGWCRPLGGVEARCSHGAVRAQSVAHSEWRGRPGSFVYAFASCQGTKASLKSLHSRQDEMLCHWRFRVLSAYRRKPILDHLCLHRDVHVDHNYAVLIHTNPEASSVHINFININFSQILR
jgi:hypothetical protein